MSARERKVNPIHAYELLGAIEAETDMVKKAMLLQEYGKLSPLNWILSLNFNHTIKLELPEGMPELPLKHMDQTSHPDFQGLLGASIFRLKNCLVGVKLPAKKKESMFIDVLIGCPMKDAEILCSAKDHALEELYPSITADLVKAVFPAFVK